MEINETSWTFLQIEEEVMQDPSVQSSDFVDEICRRFSREYNVSLDEARRLRDEAFGEPEVEDLPF
jgi:hypothetical protein